MMTQEFKQTHGAPGLVVGSGYHLQPIWRVRRESGRSGPEDILVSIKEDLLP